MGMVISDDGLKVNYLCPDVYRPIYIGEPLSQTVANKATIQIQFERASTFPGRYIAFFEDPELQKPQWMHRNPDIVHKIILKNTPFISSTGKLINWRETKPSDVVHFYKKNDLVTLCMDLHSKTAKVICSDDKGDQKIAVLKGITEHTRIFIIAHNDCITIKSCEFEYNI